MERVFAIGDIHGYLNKLKRLIGRIKPDAEKDLLVFIGDYIDRGPDSKGVVDYLINLQSRQATNMVCLLGNHEKMFMDYLTNGKEKWGFLMNGGVDTLKSYNIKEDQSKKVLPKEHLAFFKSLRPYYETEDYIFVHAGLRAGIPLSEQKLDDLIWIRKEFTESNYNFGKLVIFGHTPLSRPLVAPTKIGIDTGAGYDGKLTALELLEMRFYSVTGK
jgi:serine/threonine protein phosphatase 1